MAEMRLSTSAMVLGECRGAAQRQGLRSALRNGLVYWEFMGDTTPVDIGDGASGEVHSEVEQECEEAERIHRNNFWSFFMDTHQIPGEGAADRYEWGRSVRERISLESHAELCNPGSRDPVGLIQGQEANMKGSADVESFTPSELRRYATACGWTLAHAHCRTGSASAISGYLGDDDPFDRAIAEFGVAYADLAEADYAAFKSAVS